MLRKLAFTKSAAADREYYRNHDPVRSLAIESALNGTRDGSGRDRAYFGSTIRAHTTEVVIPGRAEPDWIVWRLEESGRVAIFHVGPLPEDALP